jgi:predicted ATPase
MTDKMYIMTGAMGAGKSAMLELLKADHICVSEPAREILAEQRSFRQEALKFDRGIFANLMLSRCIYQYKRHEESDAAVIFDSGIPDMVAYAELGGLDTDPFWRCSKQYRYAETVFLLTGWEEIYHMDSERRMTYEQAAEFGNTVRRIYSELSYRLVEVPHLPIHERTDFITKEIAGDQ